MAGGQRSVTFKGLRDELHYRLAIGVTSGLAFSWTQRSACLMSRQIHAQTRGAPGTEGGLLSPSPALMFPKSPKMDYGGGGILKTQLSPNSAFPWPARGLGNPLATFLPPSLSGAFAKPAFWAMSFAPIGCAVTLLGTLVAATALPVATDVQLQRGENPGEALTAPTLSPSSAWMPEGLYGVPWISAGEPELCPG